jgi:hypothetical protein
MSDEIKWRGSTYQLERVESDVVYWYNPVSRHHGSCAVESWNAGVPYENLTATF